MSSIAININKFNKFNGITIPEIIRRLAG